MGIDASAAAGSDAAKSGFFSGRPFAALRILATLGIVAGLVYTLSPGELIDTARDADPWMLLAALGVSVAVQALVVVKWRVLLRARDVNVRLLPVIRAYCVGNLLSNVLPTGVGGDVYRVYRIQREADARAADVTMSVLYERATGYGAMTILAAIGTAFYYGNVVLGLLALIAGVVAAGLLALILPRVPLPAVRQDHFIRNLLAHRRELIAVYRMVVFSLLIQGLNVTTIALLGNAFGVHISWWYWAFTTWLVAITIVAPITLGGFGVRETGFSALAKRAGATAAQGASTGFATAVLVILVNAAGLLCVEIAERLRTVETNTN